MPPRLRLFRASCTSAYRPTWEARGHDRLPSSLLRSIVLRRTITADEKPLPTTDQGKGPNQEPLPHVSEEAAATSKITGEAGPELEQGTPVQEILQRDKDGQKSAPQVLKKEMQQQSDAPKGSRSFSTSARRKAEAVVDMAKAREFAIAAGQMAAANRNATQDDEEAVVKTPKVENLRQRYDPVVDQVTKMMMRDGKKSLAQRQMDVILNTLRTTPPPNVDPRRPLLLHSNVPASVLPLNPIGYLTVAIDSIAPLMRIRNQRGAAGGGQALQIPVPLGLKQRRRTAIKWILDAVEGRQHGGGKEALGKKVAAEIVSVAEGKSRIWEKRDLVHKSSVAARANVKWSQMQSLRRR